jgi:hypothetical protein
VIKIFDNLRAAYNGSCCFCNTSIQESLAISQDCEQGFIKVNLPDNDVIIFNQNTGLIIEFSITEKMDTSQCMVSGMSQPMMYAGPSQVKYSIYEGVFAVGHTVTCAKCSMYDFTLQLFINLDDRNVTKAILNSESITIDDGNENVYEIRNVYTLDKTEYTHINPKIKSNTLKLPLVSDDMKNPSEVLERVKRLLIFS